jgi:hypothetical protein
VFWPGADLRCPPASAAHDLLIQPNSSPRAFELKQPNPGDFNTVPERHLAGACIERLHPDLLITESTYAASMRSDRRARETGLLTKVRLR